jgi:NAD(P)-dependent dehydrogenase (short-subunit alcohol dehydrogenase family)
VTWRPVGAWLLSGRCRTLPRSRSPYRRCIINIASVAGRIACSPLAAYTASKFALEALTESLAQELKPFNVRVAIVEPGIIVTSMARRIEHPPTPSRYPQQRRFGAMFTASLRNPASPSLVAEKVVDIVDSGTWRLRHPVGPDAEGFLGWREAMNDEEWVEWGSWTMMPGMTE